MSVRFHEVVAVSAFPRAAAVGYSGWGQTSLSKAFAAHPDHRGGALKWSVLRSSRQRGYFLSKGNVRTPSNR